TSTSVLHQQVALSPFQALAKSSSTICETWVPTCTAINIPLAKSEYSVLRIFPNDKVINGGAIPRFHQLQENYLGAVYERRKEELKTLLAGKPVAVCGRSASESVERLHEMPHDPDLAQSLNVQSSIMANKCKLTLSLLDIFQIRRPVTTKILSSIIWRVCKWSWLPTKSCSEACTEYFEGFDTTKALCTFGQAFENAEEKLTKYISDGQPATEFPQEVRVTPRASAPASSSPALDLLLSLDPHQPPPGFPLTSSPSKIPSSSPPIFPSIKLLSGYLVVCLLVPQSSSVAQRNNLSAMHFSNKFNGEKIFGINFSGASCSSSPTTAAGSTTSFSKHAEPREELFCWYVISWDTGSLGLPCAVSSGLLPVAPEAAPRECIKGCPSLLVPGTASLPIDFLSPSKDPGVEQHRFG
ncbi:hypothetical protein INR49_023117, partial [Caranx melampygus]